eukprot:6189437-Pleurochrysis_carterae.AAC.1
MYTMRCARHASYQRCSAQLLPQVLSTFVERLSALPQPTATKLNVDQYGAYDALRFRSVVLYMYAHVEIQHRQGACIHSDASPSRLLAAR